MPCSSIYEEPRKAKNTQKMESERLKSLGSGGNRKNRGQREGTGREEEGEAVRGERSRAGGREMLKVGENGGGGLKKQG